MPALQYKKEHCKLLIEHMGKGFSFSTFSAEAGVSRTQLYDWVKKFPEFAEAKEIGTEKAKRMFEQIATAKVWGNKQTNKKGEVTFDPKLSDTTMLIFLMKTRFFKDYGDRQKIEHSTGNEGIKISIDNDDSKL